MLPSFTYVKPASLAEAVRQASAPGARLHAGGTDLLGCLRDHVFEATSVVSLSRLDALRGIAAVPAGGLRVGSRATLAEIAAHPVVRQQYGALAQAASSAASPQLRNQGTIGGNLCQRPRCWYFRGDFHCARKGGETCFAIQGENQYHAIFGGGACVIVHPSDTAPALVALGARARVAGPGGTSRLVPVGQFFVLPETDVTRETVLGRGEIVTEILLPAAADGQRSLYRKVRGRGSWDFALASVAVAVTMTGDRVAGARIVLGGVAPVPWRVEAAERAVTGKRLDVSAARAAAEAAVEGAVPLEQNGYKVPIVMGIVEESLLALAQ